MAPRNEFSRTVTIAPWPDGGIDVALHAEPSECAALARRFDLVEIAALDGGGRIERGVDEREIWFRGWLEARVVQSCVVSLEPVAATIREPIERRYRRLEPAGESGHRAPRELAASDRAASDWDDDVEPLTGTEIDLGEVLAEELYLALDPYPRAPDAAALVSAKLGPNISFGEAEPRESRFAALERHPHKRAR